MNGEQKGWDQGGRRPADLNKDGNWVTTSRSSGHASRQNKGGKRKAGCCTGRPDKGGVAALPDAETLNDKGAGGPQGSAYASGWKSGGGRSGPTLPGREAEERAGKGNGAHRPEARPKANATTCTGADNRRPSHPGQVRRPSSQPRPMGMLGREAMKATGTTNRRREAAE